MTPVVSLESVTKSFEGRHALGPVDLTVPEGMTALLGPNGSGKTTMIRLLLGLIPPDAGSVKLLGEEVTPASRRRIGYVPEGDAMFPEMTGVEATAYAGELVGMRPVDALKRAHELLDYVRLGEERYRRVEGYSTGMKQRLKLAQALVHDPKMLILDEPTEGVDPEARAHLLDLITALSKEHGMHVLISTHILSDVERVAEHAIVLNAGRVAAQGTLEELRRVAAKSHVVRVAGDVTPLLDRLTAAGIAWERAPPAVRVDIEDPREVLRHVSAAGLTIRHLAPATLSLEEAFDQAVASGAAGVTASG